MRELCYGQKVACDMGEGSSCAGSALQRGFTRASLAKTLVAEVRFGRFAIDNAMEKRRVRCFCMARLHRLGVLLFRRWRRLTARSLWIISRWLMD